MEKKTENAMETGVAKRFPREKWNLKQNCHNIEPPFARLPSFVSSFGGLSRTVHCCGHVKFWGPK